jgi:hypothetical protein
MTETEKTETSGQRPDDEHRPAAQAEEEQDKQVREGTENAS